MISEKTLNFENAVIGLCLNGEIDKALNYELTVDHFFNIKNKRIFAEIVKCYYAPMKVTTQNVVIGLPQAEMIDAMELSDNAPIGVNINAYIDELKKALWLSKISNCMRAAITAMNGWKPNDPLDPIKTAIDAFNLCNIEIKKESHRTDEGAVDEYLEKVLMDAEAGGVTAIGTDITILDKHLGGGLRPGKLITLAGRPGTGKTALATNICVAISKQGYRCHYVSVETLRDELLDRFHSLEGKIDTSVVQTRKFNKEQADKFITSANTIRAIPITMEWRTRCSWEYVENVIRSEHRLKNSKVVIIDYIQQFHINTKRFQSRSQEISEITERSKALAMELEITVIILAQLNRAGEGTEPPKMSHLKDSGGIEQDSDFIGVLCDANEDYHTGLAVLKNRSGDTGMIKLRADLSINKFFKE